MRKTFIISIVLFLFSLQLVLGTSINVEVNPSYKNGLYVGDTWSSQMAITNKNIACDIICSTNLGHTTNPLPSGTIQYIDVKVSIDVHIPSPQYDTLTLTCWDAAKTWPCTGTVNKEITFTSYYAYCGDGQKNGNEQCDGSDFSEKTCSNMGYNGGTLKCTAGCLIDTSSCYKCGDGNKNPGEECDGSDFGGKMCGSYGFEGGSLSCSANCQILSTNNCYKCGDGNKNPGEECDGSDFGGNTCKSAGYDYGILRCTSNCNLDTGGCIRCQHECSSEQKQCVGDGYKTCQTDSNSCRKWSSVRSCGANMGCSSGDCISVNTNQNCGAIGRSCASNEECVDQACRSKCGNGNKDAGENCANCQQDVRCGPNEECSSGQCRSKCGNGKIDPGETCNSCHADAGCKGDLKCSGSGQCVVCIKDSDCASKNVYGGDFICSPDNKRVLEKGHKLSGVCKNNKCTGEQIPLSPKEYKDCGTQFCQDGKCGCNEGYGKCEALGKCVKRETIRNGQPCNCDVECISGYCSPEKACLQVLDVVLSSTETSLKPGEETTISLSVKNTLNKDVKGVSASLNLGSGVEMVNLESEVMDCGGNQCTVSLSELSALGREELSVRVKSNSEQSLALSATVTGNIDGQQLEIEKRTTIDFTTTPQFNIEKYLPYIGGVVIVILLIVYLIGKSHKPKKKHEESKKEKKKHNKEGEKKKESKKEEKKEEPKPKGTIAKEIEQLHSLMEKGILTEREFKKKKKRLLKKV